MFASSERKRGTLCWISILGVHVFTVTTWSGDTQSSKTASWACTLHRASWLRLVLNKQALREEAACSAGSAVRRKGG